MADGAELGGLQRVMSLKILRVDLLINGLPCLSLILDGGLLLLKSFLVH